MFTVLQASWSLDGPKLNVTIWKDNATVDQQYYWANNWDIDVEGEPGMVGVPVQISDQFSSIQREAIKHGMEEIQKYTCIR